MIGLANLPDGAYTLDGPSGPMFVRVRRRAIVWAELVDLSDGHVYRWTSSGLWRQLDIARWTIQAKAAEVMLAD